jgi:TRAP-type transport system periplasmic protein
MRMRLMLKTLLLAAGLASSVKAAPVELKFAVSVPPQVHYNAKVLIPWAEKVTADSGGTLRVKMYFSGTLGKAGQFVDIVESGAADIAMDISSYYPGRFPQADVTYMPGLIGYDAIKASDALWSMYEEGDFDKDFAGLKLLGISTPTAAMLMTTKKPVAKPSDAAGLKIGAGGKVKVQILDALHAATINLEVFNMYQPLERGVVDGVITHFTGISSFKLQEVGKYYTEVPLGGSFTPIFMSKARFDALPEQARHAIEMNSGAPLSRAMGKVWQDAHSEGVDVAKAAGGTVIVPDEATQAAWTEAMRPIIKAWVNGDESRQHAVESLRAKLAQ